MIAFHLGPSLQMAAIAGLGERGSAGSTATNGAATVALGAVALGALSLGNMALGVIGRPDRVGRGVSHGSLSFYFGTANPKGDSG